MATQPARVALITGASRGIGRAIAERLARDGYALALVGRDRAKLAATEAACRKHGGQAVSIVADIADSTAAKRTVEQCVRELGGLHVLINNAGVFSHAPVPEADLAAWDQLLDINVKALVHLTRHALGAVMEAGRRGAVINIASVAGKSSFAGGAMYCASKHAVVGFTHGLFEDIRARGVKVSAICPGYVNTEMVAAQGIDGAKALQPEDVADAVAYVLQSSPTACPAEILLRPQVNPS